MASGNIKALAIYLELLFYAVPNFANDIVH